MARFNYDELTFTGEAIDWNWWLQDSQAPSFEGEYFLPDYDSLQSNLGISEPPGLLLSNDVPEDLSLTANDLGLDSSSTNLDLIDPWLINFDFRLFSSPKDAEVKRDFDPEPASHTSNRATLAEASPSSTGTTPSAREPPLTPTSSNSLISSPPKIHGTIHCDWPSCPRTLPTKSAYNQHYKNHDRPFKCPTCGALRATKCHLMRHINERHHAVEKYYCSVPGCTRSTKHFPRRDNCMRHMKQVHRLSGEKNGV